MPRGVVKFYDKDKDYGFISYSGGDLYFRSSSFSPEKGQEVLFTVKRSKTGINAMNVVPLT